MKQFRDKRMSKALKREWISHAEQHMLHPLEINNATWLFMKSDQGDQEHRRFAEEVEREYRKAIRAVSKKLRKQV